MLMQLSCLADGRVWSESCDLFVYFDKFDLQLDIMAQMHWGDFLLPATVSVHDKFHCQHFGSHS